jgi:hypothetical protein
VKSFLNDNPDIFATLQERVRQSVGIGGKPDEKEEQAEAK